MAKRNERSNLKAGLFIVVSILLIGGVIVAIKGVRTIFTPTNIRHVRFSLTDDLGGLRLGDDVRLGGFKVGAVRSINVEGLGKGQPQQIMVTFTMPRKYPLCKNAHIGIQTTVTGTTNLNIDSLGDGEMLADEEPLTGHPSSLSALLASVGEAGPEVQEIIAHVKTKTLPQFDTVGETLASYRTLADRASTAASSVGSLFSDTKPDFRGTIANLNSITTTARAKLPAILDHANDVLVNASATVASARLAMDDIRSTATNAKVITANARALLTDNRGKFDGIIASLKATSDNLKGATAEIRRSPWRVLYHPGPGEMDNLELYDAARQFADGANSVNDAALALRDAMQNPNVDHDQVQKLIDKLNDTFANFNTVESKLWKSVKKE